MKKIDDLNLGFVDAQNYLQKANKVFYDQIFVKNNFFEKLILDTTYFLIGEKGDRKNRICCFSIK